MRDADDIIQLISSLQPTFEPIEQTSRRKGLDLGRRRTTRCTGRGPRYGRPGGAALAANLGISRRVVPFLKRHSPDQRRCSMITAVSASKYQRPTVASAGWTSPLMTFWLAVRRRF